MLFTCRLRKTELPVQCVKITSSMREKSPDQVVSIPVSFLMELALDCLSVVT
jgi:hypothetical protein